MNAQATRARPRVAGSLAVLALVVAAGAGAAGAAVLLPDRPPADLRPAAPITSAPVQQQRFADERSVPVTLSVSEATPLTAHGDGTVTALRSGAGQPIGSGTSPLDVEGRPVLALHTTVPPFRDLAADATGADVTALQEELARLGYPVTVTGRYGRSTSAAIKDLKTRAGAVKPDGDLPLAQVLWLPDPTVTPGSWAARLGSTVGTGAEYGAVPGRLTAVAATLPSLLAPGARTITLWGQSAAVDESGQATDEAFLQAVMQTRDYVEATAAEDPGDVTATIALAVPVDALKVPPTALFALDGTLACVQTEQAVLPVTVVGSSLGASLVTVDVPADQAAAPAPTAVLVDAAITAETCR